MSTALTIGMFDGVHVGHVRLVETCRMRVGPSGRVVAVTFADNPARILAPDRIPPRLMTGPRRAAALRRAGADEVVELETTADLLSLGADAFLDDLLERFQPEVIVEGPDFRFGRDRIGDNALLAARGGAMGFEVEIVPEERHLLADGTRVPARSSVIRRLLVQGRVRDAARLLGSPWTLDGQVVPGAQRGREIGCPTANLDVGDLLLPADGVYACRAIVPGGGVHQAAVSVGTNPTFDGVERTCEAHLLDFDGDLDDYDWPLSLSFHHWIREQLRYDDLASLVAAIDRDLEEIRRRLEDDHAGDLRMSEVS